MVHGKNGLEGKWPAEVSMRLPNQIIGHQTYWSSYLVTAKYSRKNVFKIDETMKILLPCYFCKQKKM
jgi:hypothetical protein